MSADLPLNRSGVTGDVSTGGESAGRPSPADATPRPPTPLEAARSSRGEAAAPVGEAGRDDKPGRGEPGPDQADSEQPGSTESASGEQPRRRRRRGRRRGRRPNAANTESPTGSAVDGPVPVSGADAGAVTPARPGEAQASRTKVTPAAPASAAAPRPPKPSDLAHATAKRRQRAPDRKPDSGGGQQPAPRPATGNRRKRGGRPDALRTAQEVSAGGLVLSSLDQPFEQLSAALIGRLDRRGRMMWSLPKGHIETGETAEQTAMREVAEETGIEGTVVAPLGKIDYWFVSEGRRIHKTVHHYLLRSTGGELSDADYEVSAVAWVPLPDLARRLTYSDERRLARMAEGVIAELTADPDRLARSEARSVRTEPNAYERAAAVRNQRRNQPDPPRGRSRRRRRRPRRGKAAGEED